MPKRTITDDNLGAWLIKCSPTSGSDLPAAIRDGSIRIIENWCVSDNYRSRMMEPGDRALLWVSGDNRSMTRGIWGAGWVTDHVRDMPDIDGPDVTKKVALHIPVLDEPLSDADLRAAGADDLEVQRLAVGSNPSWVSMDQLLRIQDLLGPWPARPE